MMLFIKIKNMSIFIRILLVFLGVNAATCGLLIYLSYEFSRTSMEKRTKENLLQQVSTIHNNFEKEYGENLRRTLKTLISSSLLDEYLFASEAEQLILAKKIERLFIQTLKSFENYKSIRFVDADGYAKISVAGASGSKEPINFRQQTPIPPDHSNAKILTAAQQLFQELETIPLLLSSGYMEWFMPSRDILINGPFVADDGTVTSLAGFSKLDLDTGTFGGVLMIQQSLDAFLAYLQEVIFFDENPVWVFDAKGRALQKPQNLQTNFDPRAYLPKEFQGTVGLINAKNALIAFQDCAILPGKIFLRIALSIPSALLIKDLKPAVHFYSLIFIISLVLILIFALYMSRYLSKPIIKLAAAVTRFARGELDTRVTIRTTGEVQTLVDSFNHMAADLHQTMQAHDASATSLRKEVSVRKQTELELQHKAEELMVARDAAQTANRAKSAFLATMSHEIRTPMNGVLGMAQLLIHTDLTSKQRRFAETIRRSGEALLSILNDILDFSKIEAGKLALEHIAFDLRETVEETVDLLAEVAYNKGLELLCLINEDVPRLVEGDPHRLRQILANLLSNAIKFTSRGEIVVRVFTQERDAESVLLRLEVCDTGVGISPEEQIYLFQPFSQVDSSTTRKYGGTGLGLSIVKELAALMGGDIGVKSHKGAGSTFWFTVRLSNPKASARERQETPLPLLGLHALIVVANTTHHAILAQQVSAWGMSCDRASHGSQALDMLQHAATQERPYAVVILEKHLPDMDGLTLARAMQAATSCDAVPLLMLRSPGLSGDAEELMRAGIAKEINKPVHQSSLYDGLVSLLQPSPTPSPLSSISSPVCEAGTTFDHANILLAEDNTVNQEVALEMLSNLGCHVHTVATGREALEALAQATYDLVLMDCQMPEMDGFKATQAIREQELSSEKTPLVIVALTAHAMQGDRQECLRAGMNDYLSKPFSQEELCVVLRRWLSLSPEPQEIECPSYTAAVTTGDLL